MIHFFARQLFCSLWQ